jgi:hypothetical protein
VILLTLSRSMLDLVSKPVRLRLIRRSPLKVREIR